MSAYGSAAPPRADGEVPGFVHALGLPGLVDVHVHFMPQRLHERVWAYFDSSGPLIGVAWPIAYRTSIEDRLATLRALRVHRFGALSYPHKPAMAVGLNQWAAEFARRTPGALRCGTFFPEPEAPDYVRDAIEAGTQVFKAHIQVGGYDPRDRLLDPVWGMLAESGTPVVVHCGNGPQPGAFTGPQVFAQVLARHPRLRAVVAHLGAPDYGAFLDLAERYCQVYLDTTMVGTDFFAEHGSPLPVEAPPRLAELGDRVVLGSDFPNIPYPYAHQLEALARLGLGDDWLRAVCWTNPHRLLGPS